MFRRWIVVIALIAMTVPLTAQRWRRDVLFGVPPAAPYDGYFSLARLTYANYPGWSYDWPDMEHNLGLILSAVTLIRPSPNNTRNILRMDDPELLKHPIAYLSEPGYWYPSDAEAVGLRQYIAKGGFLIVDDFHFANEWAVFEQAMRQVLPGARIVRLDRSHQIFNCFFTIKTLDVPYPGRLGEQGLTGEFYGVYRDNDPAQPLIVIIDYNMDIGDYMEHSARGYYAVDPTNEAYKFGINYLIYGLSH